jgi:hypothetical protein
LKVGSIVQIGHCKFQSERKTMPRNYAQPGETAIFLDSFSLFPFC